MKKIFIIIIADALFACNNSGTTNGTGGNDTNSKVINEQLTGKSPGTNSCNRMAFFQQGAEIEATSYDEQGKETGKQLTKVLEVRNENGMTVASMEGINTTTGAAQKTSNVHYDLKCDGKNIYFDMASLFRTQDTQAGASFEGSPIEYPINVAEGETLPDATGTMTSDKGGKKMEMKYHYRDRKVEAKEDVTTTGGTWSCYRITNSVEVEMNIPGMDEQSMKMMKKMQEGMKTTTTTWFAPDFGIVKMEMYMNGKLKSRNEVTGVKK